MQQGVLERMLEIEERHWWFRARQEILLALLRRWIPPGRKLLDVGCGTGYFLQAAHRDWEVWGLDPAPEAVTFCHNRGLTRVVQGTAIDLSTPDLPLCDAVCFFDVLEHLDDDVEALRTAAARLAPDGLIIATVPAYQWLWSNHDVWNHHRRRYSRTSLRQSFHRAGLEPVELGYYNCRLFPLALISRLVERSRDGGSESLLPIPVRPLNEILYHVFRSERKRLAGARPRPFRYGLSLLAVARKAPPPM